MSLRGSSEQDGAQSRDDVASTSAGSSIASSSTMAAAGEESVQNRSDGAQEQQQQQQQQQQQHQSQQRTPGRKRSSSREGSSPRAHSPSPSQERPAKTARAESPTSSSSPSSSVGPSSSPRAAKARARSTGSPGSGSARQHSPSANRNARSAGTGIGAGPSTSPSRTAERQGDVSNSAAAQENTDGEENADDPSSSPSGPRGARQYGAQQTSPTRQTIGQMQSEQSVRQGDGASPAKNAQEQAAFKAQSLRVLDDSDGDDEDGDDDEEEGNTSGASNTSFLSLSATISRGVYHQCGTARRVKVYELKGEQWFDRGTGYCAGVYDEHEDAALLVARMEEACQKLILGVPEEAVTADADKSGDESQEREAYILVVNENLDTDDLLLRTRVVRDDVYQRQQDTLVVWTEPDGKDMALSFQEAEGCQEVWEFLTEVQKHFLLSSRGEGLDLDEAEEMGPGMLGISGAGMTTDIDLVMSDGAPFALPMPRMDNLPIIDMTLKDAASRSIAAREKVAEWILRDDYLQKLVPVFHDCEDLEQLDELHRLCAIMYTIIMLNDNALVERMLRDDVFLGVVGMLEYDPEFPRLKASYRDYLTHTARYRQVVPIPDEAIKAKIHQTFRLQYFKDVILARTLDDSTYAVLNSLIFYHQADIVTFCTSNETFLSSLFQLFERDRNVSEAKKAEAIIFLQQLCQIGKQVQLPSRLTLYRTLTDWGLLIVLEYALGRQEPRLRNAAAEMLTYIIEYDASGVRAHILEQNDKGLSPLLGKLATILHEEQGDLGLKTQIAELLRILFDSGPDGSAGGPVLAQTLAAASAQAGGEGNRKDDTERFLNWFYDGEVDHMFSPLKSLKRLKELDRHDGRPILHIKSVTQSALYNHLCELLTFVIIHHSFRSQYWVNSTELSTRVASLLFAREKHLRLAALRFFRACLAKGNQFTNRHFVKIELLGAIIGVVEAESQRDNLVTSACLEFFEHIRKESIQPLINHLMEKDGDRVRALAQHVSIGHYFQSILMQWEKSKEAASAGAAGLSTTLNDESGISSVEREDMAILAAEKERRTRDLAKRGEDRAMFDADEENYFQEDEDELSLEVSNEGQLPAERPAVGSSGPGLVPYTADEDEEEQPGSGQREAAQKAVEEDQLAEPPVVPSSGGMGANVAATDSLLKTPSLTLASPTPTASTSSTATLPPTAAPIESSTKRKKGGDGEEDDDDDDMMGRLAKRKSFAKDDDPLPMSGALPSSAPTATEASSGRRLAINLSSRSSEKLASGQATDNQAEKGKES